MGRKTAAGEQAQNRSIPPSPQIRAAAEKLDRLRKERNLTLEEFARRAGRPFQTFNNWKEGHTTAMLETMEPWARVVDATLVLSVKAPGEGQNGGLSVDKPETVMIAQLVDEMPAHDRALWLKRIQDYANWRQENPPPPSEEESAPRGRKTGSRR